MNSKLEQKFETMNDAQKEQLLNAIDPDILLTPEAKARINARLHRKLPKKRVSFARMWKPVAIAAAACVMIYLTLGFTVPGVADGLYRIAHPDTTTETYFMQKPDEREPIKEIEQAIESAKPENVSGRVELIGSYSGELRSDAEFNRRVTEPGDGPVIDPNEYAYLLSLDPQLSEVYYDGSQLIVTAYFECPYAGDFLVGFGNTEAPYTHNLDMTTYEVLGAVNGTPYTFGSYGHGVIPSYNKEESGFYMQTEIDLASPLPDGAVEMTLYYYINNEDDIKTGKTFNVARVKHVFTFDTTAGNRHETKTLSLSLAGSAPITVWTLDQKSLDFVSIENRTVSFDGVTLTFEVSYLPGGVTIGLKDISAETFDKDLIRAAFNSRTEGLQFDVYVNGERIESRIPDNMGGDDWKIELPIHAEDWDGIESVMLIPKLVRMTGFVPCLDPVDGTKTGAPVLLSDDGGPQPYPEYGFQTTGWAETVLSDCAVALPKP